MQHTPLGSLGAQRSTRDMRTRSSGVAVGHHVDERNSPFGDEEEEHSNDAFGA